MYEIKKGALGRLVNSSKKRVDNKHKKLEKMASVFIHQTCQVMYNSETAIAAHRESLNRKSIEGKRINKEALNFDFQSHCFFCNKSLIHDAKKLIQSVENNDTRDNILKCIQEKNKSDEISKKIFARLKNVPNLVAVKAHYHSNCMSSFYYERSSAKGGRPASENTKDFISYLVNHINNNEQVNVNFLSMK